MDTNTTTGSYIRFSATGELSKALLVASQNATQTLGFTMNVTGIHRNSSSILLNQKWALGDKMLDINLMLKRLLESIYLLRKSGTTVQVFLLLSIRHLIIASLECIFCSSDGSLSHLSAVYHLRL